MQSTKKITNADIIVGIQGKETQNEPLIVTKSIDPNESHKLRRKDILDRIKVMHDVQFTWFTLESIVWKFNIKDKSHLFWRDSKGALTKYSNDIIVFIKRLSKNDIETAVNDYKNHRRLKRKQSSAK